MKKFFLTMSVAFAVLAISAQGTTTKTETKKTDSKTTKTETKPAAKSDSKAAAKPAAGGAKK